MPNVASRIAVIHSDTRAMTPHHRGAVLMAKAELARGQNPKLQTIARGIITGQTKELAEMKAWRMRWYGAAPPGAAAMG